MSHETLTFVVLWIVNALIALIYLLIGALVYVPACDLKQEQGEEVQYDNRRAFLIRFGRKKVQGFVHDPFRELFCNSTLI